VLTPAHAILNYFYAILETETTIAAQRMGFDPALGLMRADQRYRASLASDLMEPVRPVADEIAIELLKDCELGGVRFSRFARAFAGWGPAWHGNWGSTHPS
jgi:CRISPR/Cas system-associated endonuclease Cas1